MSEYTLHQGDCIEVLPTLPANSVQCVITSPPYWGLRDYGTAEWDGGDPGCEHKVRPSQAVESSTLQGGKATTGHWQEGYRDQCGRCGAIRIDHQIGLEKMPEEYVDRLVAIFREVWRVLRDDGTLWLNLGDSYAGSWGNYGARNGNQRSRIAERWHRPGYEDPRAGWTGLPPTASVPGLKNKNLVGIPWRIAFALQADGWYLRQEITWCKTAPMPESVSDRPTSATEKIFLLTKNPHYYYDAEAVRVTSSGKSGDGKRNLWNYWILSPQPYPEAHFATFPEKLVEPCILAGTSERGCCPKCGAPWVRMIAKVDHGFADRTFRSPHETATDWNTNATGATTLAKIIERQTTGWQPTCSCDAGDPDPCIVLDPFCGSGTTGAVALKHHRRFVGIELNPSYLELTRNRLAQVQPVLFNSI